MFSSLIRRQLIRLLPAGITGAVLAACNATTKTSSPEQTTAQAPAGQTVTLRIQSSFPTKDIFHEFLLDWSKKVDEMSGGRLKVNVLPAGAIVGAFQLMDAVDKGTLDGGYGFPAYWFGLRKAFSLFGTGPSFGMDAQMLLGWVYYGGGQELYNDLVQQQLKKNVVSFLHGPLPTQPLGWFKKEITSPADFKGLKFRTVGIALDVFNAMGAAAQAIPGGEVVASLERGVIDAAEFNNTTSDRLLGFADVRKVLMVQSYHQPMEVFELLLNKSKYDSLPKDLQAVIKYAAMAQSSDTTWKLMDRNSQDLAALEKAGVKVVKTPKSVLEAQLQAWDQVIAKESSADPFFAKVIQSQREWAARVVPWFQDITVENETAHQHFFKA